MGMILFSGILDDWVMTGSGLETDLDVPLSDPPAMPALGYLVMADLREENQNN